MAFLHVKKAASDWTRIRLRAEPSVLAGGAALVRYGKKWALYAPTGAATVNGSRLSTAMRTLRHGDEFMLGTSRYLFEEMDNQA